MKMYIGAYAGRCAGTYAKKDAAAGMMWYNSFILEIVER